MTADSGEREGGRGVEPSPEEKTINDSTGAVATKTQ